MCERAGPDLYSVGTRSFSATDGRSAARNGKSSDSAGIPDHDSPRRPRCDYRKTLGLIWLFEQPQGEVCQTDAAC